jgi:ribosome-binding factor A
MSLGRMRRVDAAIRQVIGDALGDLKDPRVGFVTVTDVRTSADLRHARVYVSVLDGSSLSAAPLREPVPADAGVESEPRRATLAGLRSARGFLQARVAAELRLKRTPTLEFHYDETTDRALRVDALIDEIGSS